MSKYPFMTVFHSCLLMSALGVIGILRTASCPVFRCYQMLSNAYRTVIASSGICSSIGSGITTAWSITTAWGSTSTAWSGVTAAWSGISRRTIIGWVLGAAALYCIYSLDGSVEVRGLQLASGSGSQAETFDVLRYRPIFLLVGASLYLQA